MHWVPFDSTVTSFFRSFALGRLFHPICRTRQYAEKAEGIALIRLNRFRSASAHTKALSQKESRGCALPPIRSPDLIFPQRLCYAAILLSSASLTCLLAQPNMCGNVSHRLAHRPDGLPLPHH
jgi:hypothetical protein